MNDRGATPARSWRTGAIVGVVVLAIGVALQLAGPAGWGRLPVLAALVAPRAAETAAIAVLAIALLLVAIARRARPVALPVGLALILAAAAGVPLLLARGAAVEDTGAPEAGTVRILSWNINGDLVAPAVVARLAAREHADLVVLPEIAPDEDGVDYLAAFRGVGWPVTSTSPIGHETVQTVVLVSTAFGRYEASRNWSTAPDSSAMARPDDPLHPAVVALHAAKPTLGGNRQWNAELRAVAAACADPNVIAVGDFNGTLDDFGSGGLGRCRDAADARSAGALGTWPTALPPLLAMPIDHVLVGSSWTVRRFSVLTSQDGSGARHRPILAVVIRR